jgi:hypothetical protein
MSDVDMSGQNPTTADLMRMIQVMQEQMGQLQVTLRLQNEENANLQRQLQEARLVPQPTAQETPALNTQQPRIKVPKPELFHGDRKKTLNFLTQVDDYLHFSGAPFISDREKVLYVATYLRDAAEQWFRPFKREQQDKPRHQWSTRTAQLFDNYQEFKKALKDAFSNVDEAKQATRTLMTITQKRSVQDYTTEFQNAAYAAEGHADCTLRVWYYKGLKDVIKQAMTFHPEPQNLDKLIELALVLDQRRTEHWYDRQRYSTNMATPQPLETTDEGGDAMELDAAQMNKSGTTRKKWTSEQRDRFKKGLCVYCGDKWNGKHDCPQRPKGERRFAAATERDGYDSEEDRELSAMRRSTQPDEPFAEISDYRTQLQSPEHEELNWTACYDDDCRTHQSDKDASGWYPKKPKGKGTRSLKAMKRTDEKASTTHQQPKN